MRLWVDDVKDPILAELFGLEQEVDGERWTWVKNANDAIPLLLSGAVTELALDNDLGYTGSMDGRDIATIMLDRVLDDPEYDPPAQMTCISYNPVAEVAIRQTFGDIARVMKGREDVQAQA
jgi:hypothetical protein